MKKRLAALLCALLLTVSALPSALALEGEGQRAADTLVTLGLLENAAYDLAAPATRAQAAVLLVGLSGGTAAAAADNWISGFRDVPAAITDEVNYASHQGWITGVTATQFRPDSPLTANAWSAFILRMLGYSDREGDFSISEAAVFAQRIGLFAAPYSGVLTQAELFETAMDVLAYSRPDSGATVAQELVSQGVLSRTAANAVGLLRPTLTARQVANRCSAAVIRLDTYASETSGRRASPPARPAASSSPRTAWRSPTATPLRTHSTPLRPSPPARYIRWNPSSTTMTASTSPS